MKKPSPSMATSVATPVALIAPLEKFRWVPAMLTPRPICPGLVPPLVVPGAVPNEKLRLKVGANDMRLVLNAVVLTLAMLLPMTSSRRALAASPERPVNSAVVDAMVGSQESEVRGQKSEVRGQKSEVRQAGPERSAGPGHAGKIK